MGQLGYRPDNPLNITVTTRDGRSTATRRSC